MCVTACNELKLVQYLLNTGTWGVKEIVKIKMISILYIGTNISKSPAVFKMCVGKFIFGS